MKKKWVITQELFNSMLLSFLRDDGKVPAKEVNYKNELRVNEKDQTFSIMVEYEWEEEDA